MSINVGYDPELKLRLSLSITRGLARLLGGDCWAESVEGQGSTFYILITAAKTSEADAERPPAYPAGPARQAVLYAPRCLASSVILANLLAFGVTAHIADIANETPPAEGPEYVLVDMDDPLANLESVQRLRARHRNSKVRRDRSAHSTCAQDIPAVYFPRHIDRRIQIQRSRTQS